LVVDGVEGGDKVEGVGLVEGCDVDHLESGVGQAALVGLHPRRLDRFGGEVVADQPTGGVGLREDVDRVAAAAADVGHMDAVAQPIR
jgi:hypothetical protein